MDAFSTQTRHGEVCPLDTTLKILDGKWKSIILCHLMQQDLRYTELLNTLPGCTRRMLSLQLSQLITDQIIQKDIDTSFVPIKTSYRLTALGQSLVPVIQAMDQWGTDYIQTLAQDIQD
ncbi:winged helix-turn-helix transcriptional regulator [Lactiplantibacillus daowaiensis]|uniref:Winged helix-turn-helix transcriptional regulator n=1 Tax=Lactiplantibacillus daowaiensis TaxID=2559918 RepID=A0ABW1S421_9LACO